MRNEDNQEFLRSDDQLVLGECNRENQSLKNKVILLEVTNVSQT